MKTQKVCIQYLCFRLKWKKEITNLSPDKTLNKCNQFTLLASQSNENVLCYHQSMKADDSIQFKEAMCKEIENFKKEKIFEVIPVKDKPDAK